jgi:hypothetical protein
MNLQIINVSTYFEGPYNGICTLDGERRWFVKVGEKYSIQKLNNDLLDLVSEDILETKKKFNEWNDKPSDTEIPDTKGHKSAIQVVTISHRLNTLNISGEEITLVNYNDFANYSEFKFS